MSTWEEPVSAFAVYTGKKENPEKSSRSKEAKKDDISDNAATSNQDVEKHKLAKNKTNVKNAKSSGIKKTSSVKQKLKTQKSSSDNTAKRKNKEGKLSNNAKRSIAKSLVKSKRSIKLKNDAQNTLRRRILGKLMRIQKIQKHKVQRNKLIKSSLTNGHSNIPYRKFADRENPLIEAENLFKWLIFPLKIDDFLKSNWEKTPVYVKRSNENYYKVLLSSTLIDKIMRKYYVRFSKHVDITSYTNGVRETHTPPGRALPSVVWDYYMNGCSVRMLNPQIYVPKLHTLNVTLQEFFGCFVGTNSYLTPPNSQGFAPHYDDIEAFVLQVEGKKRWRLYKPRNDNEYLPRYSSENLSQSEIGEPILDTIVNAGDLLYFPRGTIHQAETVKDSHSLHVTLSVYQKNTWGDFFERLLPEALKQAIENDSQFREGLPLNYLQYTGFAHSANKVDLRTSFEKKTKDLFNKLIEYINIDKAADTMAKNNIHGYLPPILSERERECSVEEDGERMTRNGVVINTVEIEPDTWIRLVRFHCVRLVEESGTYKIYYSSQNSKEYQEFEPEFVEIGEEFVPALKEIISRYPQYVRVDDLPINGIDNKIQIVKDLWEKGIIVTEYPLPIMEDF